MTLKYLYFGRFVALQRLTESAATSKIEDNRLGLGGLDETIEFVTPPSPGRVEEDPDDPVVQRGLGFSHFRIASADESSRRRRSQTDAGWTRIATALVLPPARVLALKNIVQLDQVF